MHEKTITSKDDIHRMLNRIAHEILERTQGGNNLVIIGICTRGVPLAKRLSQRIRTFQNIEVPIGILDVRPYRDDTASPNSQHTTCQTRIPINIAGKHVVLVDDVIYTGRTARAALDALINIGRPQSIHLAVLIDRGHRELPIKPDYVGKNIPSSRKEIIKVHLVETDGTDEIIIANNTIEQPASLIRKD